jgi:predicted AAA+ superfamily ATPase
VLSKVKDTSLQYLHEVFSLIEVEKNVLTYLNRVVQDNKVKSAKFLLFVKEAVKLTVF